MKRRKCSRAESRCNLSGKRRRGRKRKASLHDAPSNSTSFIMNDHGGETVERLDRCLEERETPRYFPDEDSASLHEAFLRKEFLNDYDEMGKDDKFMAMGKSELINEYIAMESRIKILEDRLASIARREEAIKDQVHYDFSKGEIPMSPEIAEKIRVFQKEIHSLEVENIQLTERKTLSLPQSSSSSSASSSSNSSSSSDNEEEERLRHSWSNLFLHHEEAQDTGYESSALREEEDHAPDLISDNAVSSSSK